MAKIEISSAVGHPTIDQPIGGRQAPDLKPAKKGNTVRNLAVGLAGLGIVAAGVGAALNAGKGEQPQLTQNPGGGIVEPSNSPIPTPFNTESPVVATPTESPVATPEPTPTPEVTPSPTPEPTPELKSINSLIDAKHPAIEAKKVKEELTELFNTYTDDPFSANALPRFNDCSDKKNTMGDRTTTCYLVISNLYRIYKETGDDKFYKAALDTYNYADSHLFKISMQSINEELIKVN